MKTAVFGAPSGGRNHVSRFQRGLGPSVPPQNNQVFHLHAPVFDLVVFTRHVEIDVGVWIGQSNRVTSPVMIVP
jgi:hypothetical protein